MSAYQIGVIVGSLRLESINRKLADALIKLAPSELSFKDIAIDKLPLYFQLVSPPMKVNAFRVKALTKCL